jgi:hypothetical protein
MTQKRIITSWVCDENHGSYREQDKQTFYRCLESWHRLMPDYDIRIVSTANILDYGSDDWITEQLRTSNGIGASQWSRLFWLYRLGGVYVDMDVEAVRRFDSLLSDRFFCGHEGGDDYVNNAVIGAPAGHPFLLEQLEYLKRLDVADPQFGNESGPRMLTNLLRKKGLVVNRSGVLDEIEVYPSSVFYPYFWNEKLTPQRIQPDTIAIHHWASSWDQRA